MTQERAAEVLGVAPRTLQGYEATGGIVPPDIVARMADVYGSQTLVWQHLKDRTPYGKFLPGIQPLQTTGDMGFQTVLTAENLKEATDIVRFALSNKQEGSDEIKRYIELVNAAFEGVLSIKLFAESLSATKSPRGLATDASKHGIYIKSIAQRTQ